MGVLQSALSEGRSFFALPQSVKKDYIADDLNHGYRPMGREFWVSADRPDLNECFVIWGDRVDLVPGADALSGLVKAWADYRRVLDPLVEQVTGHLARHFGSRSAPGFDAPVFAWTGTSTGTGTGTETSAGAGTGTGAPVDLRESIRTNPSAFGLPDVPNL